MQIIKIKGLFIYAAFKQGKHGVEGTLIRSRNISLVMFFGLNQDLMEVSRDQTVLVYSALTAYKDQLVEGMK